MMLDSPAPAIARVDHLTLPVADLLRAERFYVDVLGLPLVQRFDREALARLNPQRVAEFDDGDGPLHLGLRCGEVELDLFLSREPRRGPLRPHPHLAFHVRPQDLDCFIDRLRAHGVRVDGPRRLGPPGQASAYFTDPFGNLLELAAMGYDGEVPIGPPDVAALGHALESGANAERG